jgi:hypothetical protein
MVAMILSTRLAVKRPALARLRGHKPVGEHGFVTAPSGTCLGIAEGASDARGSMWFYVRSMTRDLVVTCGVSRINQSKGSAIHQQNGMLSSPV